MTEETKMGFVKSVRTNPNHILAIISVLLIAILCQASGAESPALQYIADDFTNAPMSQISMITTAPSLMMIPTCLLFPFFRKKLGVRKLYWICIVLLCIGGVMPAWAQSVPAIIGWRLVFGVGCGFTWPLVQSLVVELYGGAKQNTILGFENLCVCLGGILWANLGGIFALTSWRFSFYVYFIATAIMLISMIFLPEPSKILDKFKITVDQTVENTEEMTGKIKSSGVGVFILILTFVFNGFNMIFFVNVSFKIVGEAIGDSAAAGFVMSTFTIGSGAIGLLFGIIMLNKFMRKGWSMGVGWALAGLGFMIFGRATTIPMSILGAVIMGIGTGMFQPSLIGICGNLQGKQKASFWIGLMNCFAGFGQFVVPNAFNAWCEHAGVSMGSFPCTIGATVMLCGAAIFLIFMGVMTARGKYFQTS